MFDLYYWPVPFRGQPIRYLLAEAGAEWQEHGSEEIVALRALPPAERPYPFLAPPLLHDRETGTWLSQMPAILVYLGRRLGRLVEPDQTLRLACDAADILLEVTRYHGEVAMWDRPSWETFMGERLPLWMGLHEVLATANGVTADAGFLFGSPAPTVADLTLAALWGTMGERLPPVGEMLGRVAPNLAGLTARIAARPAIAALRADWAGREPRYCGGQIEASLMEMTGQ